MQYTPRATISSGQACGGDGAWTALGGAVAAARSELDGTALALALATNCDATGA
jgi:hypothetical protein